MFCYGWFSTCIRQQFLLFSVRHVLTFFFIVPIYTLSQAGPGVHTASYKVSTGVRATERRTSYPTSFNSLVWVYVDPCIHIPHGPSWPVMGIPLLTLQVILYTHQQLTLILLNVTAPQTAVDQMTTYLICKLRTAWTAANQVTATTKLLIEQQNSFQSYLDSRQQDIQTQIRMSPRTATTIIAKTSG